MATPRSGLRAVEVEVEVEVGVGVGAETFRVRPPETLMTQAGRLFLPL